MSSWRVAVMYEWRFCLFNLLLSTLAVPLGYIWLLVAVTHNEIFNAPHQGILVGGNDHHIAFNVFHD